jgi:hypothetical protein
MMALPDSAFFVRLLAGSGARNAAMEMLSAQLSGAAAPVRVPVTAIRLCL